MEEGAQATLGTEEGHASQPSSVEPEREGVKSWSGRWAEPRAHRAPCAIVSCARFLSIFVIVATGISPLLQGSCVLLPPGSSCTFRGGHLAPTIPRSQMLGRVREGTHRSRPQGMPHWALSPG